MFQNLKYLLVFFFACNTQITFSQLDSLYNNFSIDQLDTSLFDVDTIFLVPDTIRLVDTVTVFFNESNKPNWSIGIWFSSFNTFGTSYTRNNIKTNYTRLYDSYVEHKKGFSIGTNIIYETKNLTLTSGFSLLNWRDNLLFKNNNNLLVEDIIYKETIIQDTTYTVIGLDTLGMTIREEEREFIRKDSIYLENPFVNKNYYLEIPLLIGRNWDFDKWTIGIKGGYVPSFRLTFNERVISINSESALIDLNTKRLRAQMISQLELSANIQYLITERMALYSEGWLRASLRSAYKPAATIQYDPRYAGLRFGVRYWL